jgi:hypothetical protein
MTPSSSPDGRGWLARSCVARPGGYGPALKMRIPLMSPTRNDMVAPTIGLAARPKMGLQEPLGCDCARFLTALRAR